MNAHHSSSAELFKWLTAMFVELLLLPGQCRRRRRLSTGQGRGNEDSNEIAHSESVHITPSYVRSLVRSSCAVQHTGCDRWHRRRAGRKHIALQQPLWQKDTRCICILWSAATCPPHIHPSFGRGGVWDWGSSICTCNFVQLFYTAQLGSCCWDWD